MKKKTITFGIAVRLLLAGCQEQEKDQTAISHKDQKAPVSVNKQVMKYKYLLS